MALKEIVAQEVDVVVSDMRMAEMSGADARRLQPGVAAVFMERDLAR